MSSGLSREEGGGRAGDQRLSHVMLGSPRKSSGEASSEVEQVSLPQSQCVRSEGGQIRCSGVGFVQGLREPDGCVRGYMTFWNSWRDLMMLSSWEGTRGRERMVRIQ